MEAIIVIAVVLFIAWFIWRMIARNELGTFVGCGTALYGLRKTAAGTIKTKWITLFFLPLFPLKSYEVLSAQTTQDSPVMYTTQYQMVELPRLCRPQVIPVLVAVWALPLLIAIVMLASAIA